jgi:hypothetical protein
MSCSASRVPAVPAIDLPVQLAQRGYKPGLPPWINAEIANIDRRVCRAAVCAHCHKRGLLPIFYHRLMPRSYAICARCPGCGHCEEM